MNAIDAPFLCFDREAGPGLIFVLMETASDEDNVAALNSLLPHLRAMTAADWSTLWVKRMKLVSRAAFADMVAERRVPRAPVSAS